MPQLWHYTCSHMAGLILTDGHIRPRTAGIVWATDLWPPVAEALGLTNWTLTCDRTEYRFEIVTPGLCVPWVDARRSRPPGFVARLESTPGAMPMHWWLATCPLKVVQAW